MTIKGGVSSRQQTPFVPSEVEGRAADAAPGVSTSLDSNDLGKISVVDATYFSTRNRCNKNACHSDACL